MKVKHYFLWGKMFGMLLTAGLLSFASCAEGVDEETFNAGVTNIQLESPTIDKDCFSTITDAEGNEKVKFAWKAVMGAGGYHCVVDIVDDPANPVNVIDSIVDRPSVVFDKLEDTNYAVSVLTLGNDKLNNKEATAASDFAYSTLVPAITIPDGSVIDEFIKANFTPSDEEQAFELVAGGNYTMNGTVDFDLSLMTVRGNKINRPTVVMNDKAGFITQAGLKIKFINFDCTNLTSTGFLTLSSNPSESISTESLGFKADGANQDGFVVMGSVIISECMFKNLPNAILYGNKKNWSLWDFRITECIVQMNNTGSNPFIHLQGASNGAIKDMTIKNSTFFNLVANSNAYFIRYSNASNSQPKKLFGDGNAKITHTWADCTFYKTFTGKDFGNNTTQQNAATYYMDRCVFYDVFRLYQYLHNNCTRYCNNCTMHYDEASPQSNDTGGRKDNNGNPFTVEEDPGFDLSQIHELDFSKPNGGVNFTAHGAISSQGGDPRWRE